MALIEIENVTKDYLDGKTTVPALRGIDLDIEAAEFTAIAGPSGSGKTTLLNLIGGLDVLTSGTIHLDGQDISRLDERSLSRIRLRQLGFIFQSYNLVPVLTACENVEFTLLLQGVRPDQRRARAMEMLKRVGLAGHEHRRPDALSGGQQQRVAVARAIVTEPRVVLADEPTANLDSETGAHLLDIMQALNREEGTTFLFSTHDPMVMDYSTRLIRLHDGRVAGDERGT